MVNLYIKYHDPEAYPIEKELTLDCYAFRYNSICYCLMIYDNFNEILTNKPALEINDVISFMNLV